MNTLNFANPKSNSNHSEIVFIKPTTKRGRLNYDNVHDAYMYIGLKGKERKQSRHEVNLKIMVRKEKIAHWKYVKFGFYNNEIYICAGDSNDGYQLSKHNMSITNKDLLNTLFDFLNIKLPAKPDESCKVGFKYEKLDGMIRMYKLTKI